MNELRSSAAHVFVDSLDDPVLDDADDHHVRRVLRVRNGSTLTVTDGNGRWRQATVDPNGVHAVGEVWSVPTPAACVVVTAIPKGDKPELIVQKLTELGVSEIVFVTCARSVVSWSDDRAERHLQRLRRIAREAAMQSRRVTLPSIRCSTLADEASSALAASPGAAPISGACRRVLIGPEGGLTADELGRCAGTVGLGDTILRVETAAIAAATMMMLGPTPPG